MSDTTQDVERVEDTEAEPEEGGIQATYPMGVPIYPWNDPGNGTKLVEHEGEETPTGEEAIAALKADAESMAAGELDPVTGQPFKSEEDQYAASGGHPRKALGAREQPVQDDEI